MLRIERVTIGQCEPGDHITYVDNDGARTPDEIAAAGYAADEQDWNVVVRRRGHADVGDVLLQAYNGSRDWWSGSWDQYVWRLINEDGKPVVDRAVADED